MSGIKTCTSVPQNVPEADPVKLTFNREGWTVERSGRLLGPFEYLDDIDPADSSPKLDSQPKEILELKLRLRSRVHRPPLKPSKPPTPTLTLPVESQSPARRFTATASPGPEVPASGFITFHGESWIAAEAAYLYGILEEQKAGETLRAESLQPVVFYNHTGVRGVKLSRGAVFQLGEKALKPSSRTLGSSGPQTLMTFEAGARFLQGETVTAAELYSLTAASLKRFSNLDWDSRLYDVVTCIILASYFYDLFGAFPIIILLGPFESGKTRLLLSIVYMGHRGMPVLDPSEASIFRTAEAWKGFLGIDEFWEVGREVERLLRATYKRGMKVPRIDKTRSGAVTLSLFDLFGKVAVATQEPLPPNILSKGILIQLRKMPDPNPEKRDPEPADFEEVRAKGYLARLTWPPEVKSCADSLDRRNVGLSGRDYEIWKPPLTVASMMGGRVWENVLAYAKEACEAKRWEEYEELKEVLEAIYSLIEGAKGAFPLRFQPKQIHDAIWEKLKGEYRVVKEKQESGAAEKYDYDTRRFERVYSAQKIGRTYLRQLGLKGLRRDRGTEYEIRSPKDFHELVARYHPHLQSRKPAYAELLLTSKITPEMPDMPAWGDLPVGRAALDAGISGPAGINNASGHANASGSGCEIRGETGADGMSGMSGINSHAAPSTRGGKPGGVSQVLTGALGARATPERNYARTVSSLEAYVEAFKTAAITEVELREALKCLWSEGDVPRVVEKLAADGFLKPAGRGVFLITAGERGQPPAGKKDSAAAESSRVSPPTGSLCTIGEKTSTCESKPEEGSPSLTEPKDALFLENQTSLSLSQTLQGVDDLEAEFPAVAAKTPKLDLPLGDIEAQEAAGGGAENLGSCAVCGRPFHLGDGIYPHPPWLYCEACHRRTFQPERGGDAP